MTNDKPTKNRKRRRLGLQVQLVVVFLVLSLVPLALSAVLVGNIGEVAQNFAKNHVSKLRPHMEKAEVAYRELIDSKKLQYQEVTRRLASTPEIGRIALGTASARDAATEGSSLSRTLEELFEGQGELLEIEIVDRAGRVLLNIPRPTPISLDKEEFREHRVRQAIGVAGAELVAVFAAELATVEDLRALIEALKVSRRVDTVQSSLPDSYRIAFLLLVGGVVVVVTALAILFARRMGRRIDRLVRGTRRVSLGDLGVRVQLSGDDELAELGSAFNGMVADLQDERQKILYLQRIGAWQDVARKLAHEIKNPLTPIQLVVQQVVSSYKGDDEKYKDLLGTCDEIVGEEIEGLKRLVDAFRDLGRLPKVEAVELPVASVLEDLRGDPALAEHLEVELKGAPLTVSADRLLLRRTLVNLIENGIQAGQEKGSDGKVVLRCETSGEMARFIIDDEGSGVPANKREQIFDPYVTSKETGTGLGLAIAMKVALDHRGNLSVSDEAAPTGGARFVLEIPLAPSTEAG